MSSEANVLRWCAALDKLRFGSVRGPPSRRSSCWLGRDINPFSSFIQCLKHSLVFFNSKSKFFDFNLFSFSTVKIFLKRSGFSVPKKNGFIFFHNLCLFFTWSKFVFRNKKIITGLIQFCLYFFRFDKNLYVGPSTVLPLIQTPVLSTKVTEAQRFLVCRYRFLFHLGK